MAGPVGSGKTALIEALVRLMSKDYSIGVITNDIYTKEDAEFLHKNSVLPMERIVGVETGGCPHTAIREDASMNLEAVDELSKKFPDLDIIFIESGGDNLSATFSPELSVINKIDLAPYVGADLSVMERDSKKMRNDKKFIFTNIRSLEGVDKIVKWIKEDILLEGLKSNE